MNQNIAKYLTERCISTCIMSCAKSSMINAYRDLLPTSFYQASSPVFEWGTLLYNLLNFPTLTADKLDSLKNLSIYILFTYLIKSTWGYCQLQLPFKMLTQSIIDKKLIEREAVSIFLTIFSSQ